MRLTTSPSALGASGTRQGTIAFLLGPALLLGALPTSGQGGVALCAGLPVTIPAGSWGPDTIFGTPGDDVIAGGEGDDTIYGRDGNDVICGGLGDDVIYG